MRFPVITVDGPSGAGKGTLCHAMATELDYRLLDSGALYRIVGLQAFRAGMLIDSVQTDLDEALIAELTESLDIEFVANQTSGRLDIIVNGHNIANDIRNETVGSYASKVAVLPKVRLALLDLQKNMANTSGLIADGRDMGTVVFPGADAKVFLTASVDARAKRRVAQMQETHENVDYATVLQSIVDRDERDENRRISPSKPAADALVIDSSNLSAREVYKAVKEFCKTKGICFNK